MQYVYGPVLSRRLGRSLGVDPVPFKTCNLNCVYCQLGPTPGGSWTEAVYPPLPAVLMEVGEALASAQDLDFVTISGSGEPMLYGDIAELIRAIKGMTQAPVAVVTNGTLLTSQTAREALYQADVVLPSLDAADTRTFNRIVRPPGGLSVEQVIAGLATFRRHFAGQIWLEIMLVRGLNDQPEQLERLKDAMDLILPDRIHLNTVVRPPAVESALPIPPERMAAIAAYFGSDCEVIAECPGSEPRPSGEATAARLAEIVTRHPVTLSELAVTLGVSSSLVAMRVAELMAQGVIESRLHHGRLNYVANRANDGLVGLKP
ncbi:MAG TPA: radical SAM protein [Rhodothermia bacterium]|nr:radical SAM protein [Rhodothermia bacterium]